MPPPISKNKPQTHRSNLLTTPQKPPTQPKNNQPNTLHIWIHVIGGRSLPDEESASKEAKRSCKITGHAPQQARRNTVTHRPQTTQRNEKPVSIVYRSTPPSPPHNPNHRDPILPTQRKRRQKVKAKHQYQSTAPRETQRNHNNSLPSSASSRHPAPTLQTHTTIGTPQKSVPWVPA